MDEAIGEKSKQQKGKHQASDNLLLILFCAGLGAIAAYLIWVKFVFNNRQDCNTGFVLPISNCTKHIYNAAEPIDGWDQFFGSAFTFFGAVTGGVSGKALAAACAEQNEVKSSSDKEVKTTYNYQTFT